MGAVLSDTTRQTKNLHFGQADLLAFDTTQNRFISFGYTQDASLEVSWEEAQLESGSPAVIIDTEITKISVTLSVQILELSSFNLTKLLPAQLTQLTTGETLESNNEITTLTGVVDSTLRFPLILDSVDGHADPVVTSTDGVTTYTAGVGNDYIITKATGLIKRDPLSTIPDGAQVQISYFYNDSTAQVINMGGRQCSSTTQSFQRLQAISRSKNCAVRGVEIYKAAPQSPLTVPFGNTHTIMDAKFIGQDDDTRPLGLNLFKFILGSASQI